MTVHWYLSEQTEIVDMLREIDSSAFIASNDKRVWAGEAILASSVEMAACIPARNYVKACRAGENKQ